MTASPDPRPAAARKRTCFVIAPIGDVGSETRKKSDQALKHLIKHALEPSYGVERADDISRPGLITFQIVQQIFDAELVVADLTDRNPNVYYELAIRHATQKPVVHIISKGQDIPFDVQDMRVVRYDLTDPDCLETAREELLKHVQAVETGEPVVSPVQFAQILQSLESGEDRDLQIRAVFESLNTGISNLQASMAEVVSDVRARSQVGIFQNPFLNTNFNRAVPLAALGNPSAFFGEPPQEKPGVFKRAAQRAKESRKKE